MLCDVFSAQHRAIDFELHADGLAVTVRQHLDGRYTIMRGTQRLDTFRADGRPIDAAAAGG